MYILINGTFFTAPRESMTGLEIKKFAGIHSFDVLYRLEPFNGYEVKDDDEVRFIEHDVFVSATPIGYSS